MKSISSDPGLIEKYRVKRVDQRDKPGQKHENCLYFVLDIAHDRYARAGIFAYATACKQEFPKMSKQLFMIANQLNQGKSIGGPIRTVLRGNGTSDCCEDLSQQLSDANRQIAVLTSNVKSLERRLDEVRINPLVVNKKKKKRLYSKAMVEVVQAVFAIGGEASVTQIAELLEMSANGATTRLARAKNLGLLKKAGYGIYASHSETNKMLRLNDEASNATHMSE